MKHTTYTPGVRYKISLVPKPRLGNVELIADFGYKAACLAQTGGFVTSRIKFV